MAVIAERTPRKMTLAAIRKMSADSLFEQIINELKLIAALKEGEADLGAGRTVT